MVTKKKKILSNLKIYLHRRLYFLDRSRTLKSGKNRANRSPIVIIHNSSSLLTLETNSIRQLYPYWPYFKNSTERKQSPVIPVPVALEEKKEKRGGKRKKNELLQKEKKEIGPLQRRSFFN